jgi:hypothetical protein
MEYYRAVSMEIRYLSRGNCAKYSMIWLIKPLQDQWVGGFSDLDWKSACRWFNSTPGHHISCWVPSSFLPASRQPVAGSPWGADRAGGSAGWSAVVSTKVLPLATDGLTSRDRPFEIGAARRRLRKPDQRLFSIVVPSGITIATAADVCACFIMASIVFMLQASFEAAAIAAWDTVPL